MNKKIFLFLLFALISGGLMDVNKVSAAEPTFPSGCSSALGFSITTGSSCNGTTSATIGFLPGCVTAIGYSIITGQACSGGTLPIQYLSGCSSVLGYSTITGAACNGTNFATLSPTEIVINPGLPTTGEGGNAPLNVAISFVSAALAAIGIAYLVRKNRLA